MYCVLQSCNTYAPKTHCNLQIASPTVFDLPLEWEELFCLAQAHLLEVGAKSGGANFKLGRAH